MTGYVGKTTNLHREVIAQQAQAEREDQWGPMPGEIVSYDAAAGTATVKPLFKKKQWDGSDLPLPELLEVPIDLPRTGNAGLTFPIPPGTRVQLTPQMRSMENYDHEDDGSFSDMRSFNLSDMRASVVGGDSLKSPMENVDADNTHLRFSADGLFGIKGSPDGKLEIKGAEGEWLDLLTTHVEQSAHGFHLLATEPALVHTADYEVIGDILDEISAKLRAMII